MIWPDSFYVTYDHLVTGETTAIRENGAASGIGVIGTIAYDNLGRRTSLTLGNGVATHYTYDAASRLDELKLDYAGSGDDLTSKFFYNPASQIAKNVRSNDAYSWTGHGTGTTTATSNGVPGSANGLNQIGSWVSTLGYDSKGNVTTDGTYTYAYSSENLLTSLTNSAPGAAQPNIAFAYDPLMRLSAIDSTNSGFDVEFGYDGQEMVLEALSAGRTRRYVHGPGTDEPLVAYLTTPGVGTSRVWYQADERGSIVRNSLDSGAPTSIIGKYDEYGAGGTGRFRYTGQYWLGEANLLYYRARVYDARLGRFLQPDPIGYGAGMNMYAYVGGDPVNSTDPSGLTEDSDLGEAVVNGKRLQVCGAGYMQIGGICASGVNVSSIIFSGNSFSFSTSGAPDIGPGVDCTAQGNVVTCALPEAPKACNTPSGPVVFGGVFSEGYLLSAGLGRAAGLYRDITSGETGVFGSKESGFGWGASFGLEAGIATNMDSFRGEYSTIGGGAGLFGVNYAYRQGDFFDDLSFSVTLGLNAMGEAQWGFDADVTTDVTGAALKEVFGEIRRLQNEAVPDEEAAGMRTWMAGTFVLQNASAAGLIGSVAERDFHGLPADWLTAYVPSVLKVSGADMRRLAAKTLPLDKMILVVVGDLAKVEPQLKAMPELRGMAFQRVTPFR